MSSSIMMTQHQTAIALICIGLLTFVYGAILPSEELVTSTDRAITKVESVPLLLPPTGTTTAPTVPPTPAPKYCHSTIPCGWAVYDPLKNRQILYFKQNHCTCRPTTECKYFNDDDLSAGAYVYQCRRPDGSFPPD